MPSAIAARRWMKRRSTLILPGFPACRGGVQADTPSDDLRQAVQVPEFQVDINLNCGEFSHTVYTTDLSPEYVDFNRSGIRILEPGEGRRPDPVVLSIMASGRCRHGRAEGNAPPPMF